MIQNPGDLCGGEIGIQTQTGFTTHFDIAVIPLQLAAAIGSSSVLPHDGIVEGSAAAAIPDDGGLTLVGNADGDGETSFAGEALQRLGGRWTARSPKSLRRRVRPSPGRDRSAQRIAVPMPLHRPRRKSRSRAWNSFPDRWRAKIFCHCAHINFYDADRSPVDAWRGVTGTVRHRPRTLSADRPHISVEIKASKNMGL